MNFHLCVASVRWDERLSWKMHCFAVICMTSFIHSTPFAPPLPAYAFCGVIGFCHAWKGIESLCRGFAGMQIHGCVRLFCFHFGFSGWRTWSSAGTSPFAKQSTKIKAFFLESNSLFHFRKAQLLLKYVSFFACSYFRWTLSQNVLIIEHLKLG